MRQVEEGLPAELRGCVTLFTIPNSKLKEVEGVNFDLAEVLRRVTDILPKSRPGHLNLMFKMTHLRFYDAKIGDGMGGLIKCGHGTGTARHRKE